MPARCAIFLALAVLQAQAFTRFIDHATPVRVRIDNDAGAPAGVIDYARAECSRILKNAGIAVEWTTAGRPADLRVTISSEPGGTQRSVLGYVLRNWEGASAYVIWPRVGPWLGIDTPAFEIVGRVMAHEIGHLLLGNAPHSETGIMRAVWTADDLRSSAWGAFFFTPAEQSQMRAEATRRCAHTVY